MPNEQIENQQQEAPKPAYNPLMDVVNEKPYSVGSFSANPEQLMGGIPEPVYQPQNIGGRENPYKTIRDQSGTSEPSGSGGGKRDSQPVNPAMRDLPDSEKKEGAKYVAKMIMDIHEQIYVFLNSTLPISQKKLRKLQAEQQIDLNMPVTDGATAGQIIEEFNNEVKDALVLDPKWRKETTPILEAVLAKRGAAMTDEQMLLFQYGKKLGIDGIQYFGIKKQQGEIFQLLIDLKERYDSSGGNGYMPPRPEPQQRTEQPYAYAPETQNVNSDTFNFDDNEAVMSQTVTQMRVPKTGKERSIAQRQKETKWAKDSEQALTPYEIAMEERKTGKKGRAKKSPTDYVKAVDKDEIVDALILSETKNSDLPSENENND